MKPTDVTDLTAEQKAKLAYALSMIRDTQTLAGWSQYRAPKTGALGLVKRRRGVIQQVYVVTYGA